MNKYNEIMENVKVSDEMRKRILSNIDKETKDISAKETVNSEEKKKARVINFRKIGRTAAVFAMLIVGLSAAGLVLGRFGGGESSTSEEAAYQAEPSKDTVNYDYDITEESPEESAVGSAKEYEQDSNAYSNENEISEPMESAEQDLLIESSEALDSEKESSIDSGRSICESFLSDEYKVNGKTFSETYESFISEFDQIPSAYYVDVNNDGIDDLVVDNIYYGLDIYFCDGNDLYYITGGDGTSNFVSLSRKDDKVYVLHSDTIHSGRLYYEYSNYDMDGNDVESTVYRAVYEDSETGTYNENSTFTRNEENITMEEFEEELSQYKEIDITTLDKAN